MATRNRFEPDIPSHAGGELPDVKRTIESLCLGVRNWARLFDQFLAPRPTIERVQTGDTFAAFGTVTRVRALDGQTLVVTMRNASEAGGREVRVLRLASTGTIWIVPVNCLINGRARYLMTANVGFVTVLSDGENLYTDMPGGAAWNEGA